MRTCFEHILFHVCRMLCVLLVLCGLASCRWHDAREVVALADSIDQNYHVIYDDTVALHNVIQALNNPLGRTFQRTTLGKAFYYMGRNLEDDYSQVARAAECYVAADWLRIDDPIYRGRVNSCMGQICGNYNQDSLSLLFYERAHHEFKNADDDVRYAYSLLDMSVCMDALNRANCADSLWQLASKYTIDDEYKYYLNDVRVHHFVRLDESNYADSIAYYLQKIPIVDSWSSTSLANAFYALGQMDSAAYYAWKTINEFNVPSHKVSSYYILHKYAIYKGDILAADSLASLRMDEKRKAEVRKVDSLDGIKVFEEYLAYCDSYKWHVLLYCLAIVFGLSAVVALLLYWRRAKKEVDEQAEAVQMAQEAHQQALEEQRQQRLQALNMHIEQLRVRYPMPDKKWNDYQKFRTELNQLLLCLFDKLAERKLSEKEIRLCVYCMLYKEASTKTLAEYVIYSPVGIRTFKQRTAQKIGTTAANLYEYLVELAISI